MADVASYDKAVSYQKLKHNQSTNDGDFVRLSIIATFFLAYRIGP